METAIAVIADQGANLKIDTQHLRELSLRIGSIFQFIGELNIQLNNEVNSYKVRLNSFFLALCLPHLRLIICHDYDLFQAILQARTGRNVDGIDLDLYYQSLQHLRQFQAKHMKNATT